MLLCRIELLIGIVPDTSGIFERRTLEPGLDRSHHGQIKRLYDSAFFRLTQHIQFIDSL